MAEMGGNLSLQPPKVRLSRLSSHLSGWLLPRLALAELIGLPLTIWDCFGTPGDTLLAATVARIIRGQFPRLKLNLITPNPDLLRCDPHISELNGRPSVLLLRFWYPGIIHAKDGVTNILAPTLAQVGISDFSYRSRVFLEPREIQRAHDRLGSVGQKRPLVTMNVQSREKVKVWPLHYWEDLVSRLLTHCDVVQLGTEDEPVFPGVVRMAGRLEARESMAILAHARLHIGGVSFLMHAANGLDVPSVVIYGGRETPANSGYADNTNLFVSMPCGPCWIHDSLGEVCLHDVECMLKISVDEVHAACRKQLAEFQSKSR
jgi:hypothetical protein